MGSNAAPPHKADTFPIVAVGASAGGLEAFTQLLRAVPNSTGMAFVLIQHLDPKHHSMLSELLGKASSMPVLEAKDGTAVQPNKVYVIPPNVNMGILRRRLQLTPRAAEGGQHAPVDFFMRSLAEARNSRSIGVVLSGTASDGTRGLAAIKAEGGITFAQDERSARYNGMPHSAIASGCVDFILPPEKIGQELARISGHPYLSHDQIKAPRAVVKKQKPGDDNFEKMFALLRNTCGVNFREYKPGTVQRRTLRRMALLKMDRASDYMKYLGSHPSEVEALCQDLLIPVTSFFRDLAAFEALKSKVFPSMVKDKTNRGAIRIWAPGCSTGEETYSLAIVLLEFLGDKASSFQIQLFGTDVNERGIEKARAGIYEDRIAQEISPDRLRRFFTKVDGGYRVSKSVRDICVFAKQNLAEDPPFSQLNLVACRNLLIYFGAALQSKVIPILHYALRPSGFVILGNAESVAAFPNLFDAVDKKNKIFVKRTVPTRLHYDFSANRYPRETSIPGAVRGYDGVDAERQQEADRVVLKNYAPPGVIINEEMEIFQFRGAIGPYVEPSPGRATLHLLKIARKEFVSELRAAVNQAKKSHLPVKRRSVEFRRNGQLRSVNISVEPLGTPEDRQYLILFEPRSPSVSPQRKTAGKLPGLSGTAKGAIEQLRRKLAAAEEHLHSVIESKEASDEEYQSANEEILSANEELQSTNEELETSKEELQSANEELNTVNDELHNRNIDLDRASSDLNNVLASTSLPVVMVDRGLRIRRLTAATAKVLKILPSDTGRPITDIRSDINVPHIDELITGVIETLAPKEMEVQDKDEHWYSLQIRSYRTTDDKIDGAVLVLSDIDAAKRLSERLRKAKEFTEDILDTVREPLAVLSEELKVVYVNPSFLKVFRVNRWETEGKYLYNLGNEQWNIPKLRTALEEVLSKDMPLLDFEVEHDFPSLGVKTMLLNARYIIDGHSNEPTMLLAIEDISDRKQAEMVTASLAAIVQSSHDAIISKGIDSVITSWNAGAERLFGYTAQEAIGQPITMLMPRDRQQEEPGILARLMRGETIDHFESVRKRKDGSLLDVSLTISPLKDSAGRVVGASKIARDITDRKREEALIDLQRQGLRLLAEGSPLEDILAFLIGVVERHCAPGMLASIVLLNESGTHFQRGVGASLPDPFNAAVEGASVSSPNDLCATAARRREAVAVHDFNADATWRSFGEFVAPYGLRSGWSIPIISSRGQVLGTFANYYRHVGDPRPQNRDFVDMVLSTAAIAIERRQSEEAVRKSHATLERIVEQRTASVRELSSSLIRLQDEERRRISRELHDSLGQDLAHAKLSLLALKRSDATPKEESDFASLVAVLEKCLMETRTISYLLHPPLLDDVGLHSAVQWYVEGFSERSGIKVNLNIPPEIKRLPVVKELTLFRVLQEALTNINRHSQSPSVNVRLELAPNDITLEVKDYGQGMPPELVERLKAKDDAGVGVGLRSMRERISELGGQFEIESDKNGTLIRGRIPLNESETAK